MVNIRTVFLLLLLLVCFIHPVGAQTYPFQEQKGYIITLTDIHIGIGDKASQKLVQHFLNLETPPQYIFVGGDLTEMGSDYEFERLKEYYQPLEGKIPIGWMMGNHDARWSTKAFYMFGREMGPERFVVDFGKFVFVGLNSATLLEQHGHIGFDQYQWVKEKLASMGKEKPVIMQIHHPFGGPSQFTDDGYLLMNLIRDYNVPLVLYGHGHSYNFSGSFNHTWFQMLGAGMNQYYSPISWDEENLYLWKAHPEEGVELVKEIPLQRAKRSRLDWIRKPSYDRDKKLITLSLETRNIQRVKLKLNQEERVFPINKDDRHDFQWQLKNSLRGKELLTIEAEGEDTTHLLSIMLDGELDDIRWVFSSGASLFTQPLLDGDYLYFGNQRGDFYKLNRFTGKVVWNFQARDAIFATPVIYGDMVIFAATDQTVYALDRQKGILIWKKELPGVIYHGLVAGKKVIAVGTGDSKIYGLKPENGEILWTQYAWGMVQSRGTYYRDSFIFTSWGGVIQQIDELSGQSLQAFSSGSGYSTPGPSRPVVYQDWLLYTNTGSRYAGQSLLQKGEKWEVRGPKVGYASVALADKYAFLSTLDGEVFKFDPLTGKEIWSVKLPQAIYDSSPQCFKDYLAVGSITGDVWVLSLEDGSIKKHVSLGNGFIFGKIKATTDTLYVPSMDGNLYALDLDDLY